MAIVQLLLGGLLLWLARFVHVRRQRQLVQARLRSGWPTVSGTITSNAIDEVEEERTESDGTTDTVTRYAPAITYTYTAHGASRTGSRIHVLEDAAHMTRGGAQAVCARYPLGATVAVHVGPTPEDGAFLDGRISEAREKAVGLFLAAILGGTGLVMALLGVAQLAA